MRAWKPEDKEQLAELLNNRNILNNLRDGIPFPYTAEDAEHFIRSMLSADKTQTFAFAITANGETVGSIGAFRGNNIHACTAELGYYIGERFWGKGIATCAVKQICDYIFKNTDIIRILQNPSPATPHPPRAGKSGFQYEGTLRNNAVKNGSVLDMKLYAILKKDSAVPC